MTKLVRRMLIFAVLGIFSSSILAIILAACDAEMKADPLQTAALRRSKWQQAERAGKIEDDEWVQAVYSDRAGDLVIKTSHANDGTAIVIYTHQFGWPLRSMQGHTIARAAAR